jgi:predicted ester cyclase
MAERDNKELTWQWTQIFWNDRNPEGVIPLMTANPALHVSGATLEGIPTLDMVADQWFDPFPNLRAEVVLQVAEGDRVSEHLVFSGTHTGAPYHPGLFRSRGLPPIPTSGKPFEFTQTHIIRIEEGKIAEIWEDFDRVRFWMQLGVTLGVPDSS